MKRSLFAITFLASLTFYSNWSHGAQAEGDIVNLRSPTLQIGKTVNIIGLQFCKIRQGDSGPFTDALFIGSDNARLHFATTQFSCNQLMEQINGNQLSGQIISDSNLVSLKFQAFNGKCYKALVRDIKVEFSSLNGEVLSGYPTSEQELERENIFCNGVPRSIL